MKQEWNYFVEKAKLWKTFHQQPMLYCNMQGELLIRLVSGLQVRKQNSECLLQNLGDGLGMIAAEKECLYYMTQAVASKACLGLVISVDVKVRKAAVVPDVLARIKANWSCTELYKCACII